MTRIVKTLGGDQPTDPPLALPTTGELCAAQPGATNPSAANPTERPREIGGRQGLEPTRYGDWESKGRCIDF